MSTSNGPTHSLTGTRSTVVRLIVFSCRALQGTLLHAWLDEFRLAGIEFAVIGSERDAREIDNTALILNTAHVDIRPESDEALSDTIRMIARFRAKLGLKDSEIMIVSASELDRIAARTMHMAYCPPIGLEILLKRSGSIEKAREALEWIT